MKNRPGEPGVLPNPSFQPPRCASVELLCRASLILSKSIHHCHPWLTELLVSVWRAVSQGFSKPRSPQKSSLEGIVFAGKWKERRTGTENKEI